MTYSMPESVSEEWFEDKVKWDSIKFRAQALWDNINVDITTASTTPMISVGYGFEGLI